MTDSDLPGLSISASADTIEIRLPTSEQTYLPTIPEELRDREIPPFVVEWILESDEIATVVQELLQAPTKSLCRMYQLPTNVRAPLGGTPQLGQLSPTPKVLRGGLFEVSGFAADPGTVPSLPEGIQLPYEVLHIVVMARKIDAWLTKGQRVLEWSAEQGVPDASWMPATAS